MAEPDVDLDAIAADLDDVERALTRLDDGTYWTDEVTGTQLDDEVLARSPIARTATAHPPIPSGTEVPPSTDAGSPTATPHSA